MNDISPLITEKAPLIMAEIKKASSILLHCHPSPDPDSVGSALAMKFALEQMGKKATVIKGDSEIPRAFMHFPGADSIVKKNFGEIDLSAFDLFIIQDSGSPEMVSRIAAPKFPLAIRSIVIDHHSSNKGYADINLVDLTQPATASVLYHLFKEWNITITSDIAANLFIGMYTDTGAFKYPPADYRTLLVAGELARAYPDFPDLINRMENSVTKGAIRFRALALQSIETFFDDRIAISAVSYDLLRKTGVDASELGGEAIPNMLMSVVGWCVGISCVEVEKGKIKLSMRSRDSTVFDVSKLALALGGGGHRAAAGALLTMDFESAKKLLVEKIKEVYNL